RVMANSVHILRGITVFDEFLDRTAIHEACEQSSFGQGDVFDVFAEERLRGFAETADVKRSVLAKTHLVDVHGKDLLFGQAMLEYQRDGHLGKVAMDAAFVCQKKCARHLHGESGTTFDAVTVIGASNPSISRT